MVMKVLVVDDHPLIRSGVTAMLHRHDGDCVALEAPDCRTALHMLGQGSFPDLVLLDLHLPDCMGLEAIDAVRQACPGIPIVVLSAEDDRKTILDALNRGAMGFIPKTMNPDLIWSAIGLVLAGGIYVPHTVIAIGEEPASARVAGSAPAGSMDLQTLGLTRRQIDTLHLLVQGLSNKMIARKLDIAEATVKVHVTAVMRALNVTTRTQAVIWLSRHGIRFDGVRT